MATSKLTIEMLPALVERIVLGYDCNSNPLHDIRKEFSVDTHFEYQNGSNLFFMGNNSKEVIYETTGASDNTLFVFLQQTLIRDGDGYVEDLTNEVVIYFNGFFCDGREPQKSNHW